MSESRIIPFPRPPHAHKIHKTLIFSSSGRVRNAYHTLFVARLSYDTTEKKLRREFENYGPIKAVKMVTKRSGDEEEGKAPRGYAFIEFEREEDMTAAYSGAKSWI